MATLRLQKVRSYTGLVHVTAENPVVEVDDATAAQLLATGFFVNESASKKEAPKKTKEEPVVAHDPEPAPEPAIENPDYEALSVMTKAELTAVAESNGISIEGCKTKADILEAISVACGGNYTMIELQKR